MIKPCSGLPENQYMGDMILLYSVVLPAAIIVLITVFTLGIAIGKMLNARKFSKEIKTERADAVKRSRAVLNGQLSEQLAAYFPGFPADPTEVRFVGKPVDFIAFCGASSGAVTEVRFIEVKTGDARLSKVEQSLRDAIEKKRIQYCEYRIPAE